MFFVAAVEKIIRNHQKEEIKRRMSHGEGLKLNGFVLGASSESETTSQEAAPNVPAFSRNAKRPSGLPLAAGPSFNIQSSSNSSSTSVNEYKNVIAEKPDFFKASVMVRSQSSSSNTSR